MLSSSKLSTTLPSTGHSSRNSDGSLTDGEDIYMTIDTDNGAEFFAVEPPRALDNVESFQNERQISMDPVSIQGSTAVRQASFMLVSTPGSNPSPPTRLQFMSGASLPRSPPTRSPSKAVSENETRRSRSLGPAGLDDFDLWSNGKSNVESRVASTIKREKSKPPLGRSGESRKEEDGFNCGRLCLFLPRKGSGKAVRSSSSLSTTNEAVSQVSQISRTTTEPPAISRTVSLERFDCGSWSSAEEKDAGPTGDTTNLFFDLPTELLRCSVSGDMQSPVNAAFVFSDDNNNNNNNNNNETRGVLKSGYSKRDVRKSPDSMKHVRFSTSSPEDFEEFLGAQPV